MNSRSLAHDRWTSLLNDERDLPLLRLAVTGSLIVPCAIAVFVASFVGPVAFWAAAVTFVVCYFVHLERFITMFHDVNHHRLFVKRFEWLNNYIYWVFGPLYGSTPNSYHCHHVLMHHPTNNMADDESSTLGYRRDSKRDFLRYYVRFFFSIRAVARFCHERYRKGGRYARKLLVGELAWFALIVGGLFVDLGSALVVFVVPLVTTRSLMIMGNWGEHAFIDPDDPGNLYRNSVDLIGALNERCYNVGYHTSHHIRPGAHFSTHPAWFDAHIERYGREDAIVLRDLHYHELCWLLIWRRYDTLASRFVQLPGAPERDQSEIVALLKSRAVPIVEPKSLEAAHAG